MKDFKPFSEYRDKDYHIPRTMREAYGYEPVLYVQTEKQGLFARFMSFILGSKEHG